MNSFTGEIPEEIFHLHLLSRINISANNLSGEIPSSISSCTSLTSSDFSRNNLSGEIPKEMGKLRDLSIINLSHNSITGHIPDEMCELTSLTTLDLSYNNLAGRVPPRCVQSVDDSSFAGNPNLCTPSQVSCLLSQLQDSGQARGKFCSPVLIVFIVAFVTILLLMPPRQRCERKGGAGIVECGKVISELKEVRRSLISGTGGPLA
jgi:hypothetical protein